MLLHLYLQYINLKAKYREFNETTNSREWILIANEHFECEWSADARMAQTELLMTSIVTAQYVTSESCTCSNASPLLSLYLSYVGGTATIFSHPTPPPA